MCIIAYKPKNEKFPSDKRMRAMFRNNPDGAGFMYADGDAVGSAAALCLGLRQLGKTAFVLDNPELTEKYRPYLEGLTCDAIGPDDTIIAVAVAIDLTKYRRK